MSKSSPNEQASNNNYAAFFKQDDDLFENISDVRGMVYDDNYLNACVVGNQPSHYLMDGGDKFCLSDDKDFDDNLI